MSPRPRTALRILLLVVALGFFVTGRVALIHKPWADVLLGNLGGLGRFLGGFFAGVTHTIHAPAFLMATAGTVLLGFLLPIRPAHARATDPLVLPLSTRTRLAILFLCLDAASLGLLTVRWLRVEEPSTDAVWAWLVAMTVLGAAAWLLDRQRGTSFGNPLPARADWIAVICLFAGDLLLVGHDVGHWRWSGTPDESNFFPFAVDIAEGKPALFVLSETGMFGVHPVLSSYYQAAFMRLFGMDAFGWRLSSAFALAGSLPFVYVLGRELRSRRFGLWAAILFGTTPLAVGFAHFGYNNAQVWLFVTASLAVLAWSVRRRSAFGFYFSGTIAGLAVFTFYPARVALPLLLLLAVALREAPWRAGKRTLWCVLALAALIAAAPCLAHPLDSLSRMFGQTAFQAPRGAEPAAWPERVQDALTGKAGRVARHWAVSILHPIWYPNPSHFQTTAVVDPLQAVLAISGLVLAWRGFRRDRASRFLALAYPFSALAVGAVSQHDCPPLTRLLFLCPFTSMLAALSLDGTCRAFENDVARRRLVATAGSVVIAVSAVWGVYILRANVYERAHGYGEGTTSELARIMRALPQPWQLIHVQRVPTYMASVDTVVGYFRSSRRFTFLRTSEGILQHMPGDRARYVLIAHDLPPGPERENFEKALAQRFPETSWRETAPGTKWNLRVLPIGSEDDGGWQYPALPERGAIGQLVLGGLDW